MLHSAKSSAALPRDTDPAFLRQLLPGTALVGANQPIRVQCRTSWATRVVTARRPDLHTANVADEASSMDVALTAGALPPWCHAVPAVVVSEIVRTGGSARHVVWSDTLVRPDRAGRIREDLDSAFTFSEVEIVDGCDVAGSWLPNRPEDGRPVCAHLRPPRRADDRAGRRSRLPARCHRRMEQRRAERRGAHACVRRGRRPADQGAHAPGLRRRLHRDELALARGEPRAGLACATISGIGPEAAVEVLHRRRSAEAPVTERDEPRAEPARRHLLDSGGLVHAVDAGVVDEIVDPRHTRNRLVEVVAALPVACGSHTNMSL